MECENEHSHCFNCVTAYCKENPSCPVEYCKNSCGSSMHGCKWPDHDREICPEALVNCTNASYGCKERIRRKNLSTHILHCPASTVHCRFVHSRRTPLKLGECALKESGKLIDEQLLDGDMQLLQDLPHPTPCLGLSTENITYTIMMHQSDTKSQPMPTNQRFHSRITRPSDRDYTQTVQRDFFHCNQTVRRDEFSTHWNYHMDVLLAPLVQRCPLSMYGCTHAQQILMPLPPGTGLKFSCEMNSFFVTSPPHPSIDGGNRSILSPYETKIREKEKLAQYGYGDDEEESYDVIGQLPLEVLLMILSCLDSISLWSMSMVNQYFRRVCFCMLAKEKGIIYRKWRANPDIEHPTWTPLEVYYLYCWLVGRENKVHSLNEPYNL